jgi:hypothetical protein
MNVSKVPGGEIEAWMNGSRESRYQRVWIASR